LAAEIKGPQIDFFSSMMSTINEISTEFSAETSFIIPVRVDVKENDTFVQCDCYLIDLSERFADLKLHSNYNNKTELKKVESKVALAKEFQQCSLISDDSKSGIEVYDEVYKFFAEILFSDAQICETHLINLGQLFEDSLVDQQRLCEAGRRIVDNRFTAEIEYAIEKEKLHKKFTGAAFEEKKAVEKKNSKI